MVTAPPKNSKIIICVKEKLKSIIIFQAIVVFFVNVYVIIWNKAISMMCGKSPRSDVEMSKKTKFPGGHLGLTMGTW